MAQTHSLASSLVDVVLESDSAGDGVREVAISAEPSLPGTLLSAHLIINMSGIPKTPWVPSRGIEYVACLHLAVVWLRTGPL